MSAKFIYPLNSCSIRETLPNQLPQEGEIESLLTNEINEQYFVVYEKHISGAQFFTNTKKYIVVAG